MWFLMTTIYTPVLRDMAETHRLLCPDVVLSLWQTISGATTRGAADISYNWLMRTSLRTHLEVSAATVATYLAIPGDHLQVINAPSESTTCADHRRRTTSSVPFTGQILNSTPDSLDCLVSGGLISLGCICTRFFWVVWPSLGLWPWPWPKTR